MKPIGVRSSKPTVCLERCSRVLFFGATCDKCLAGCPTRSIHVAYPSLTIDDTCSGCGFCVALCPNEVFALQVDNHKPVHESEKLDRLYCASLLDAGTMPCGFLSPSIIPCLGSISTSFILDQAIKTERPLEVVTGSCRVCALKAGEESYRMREEEIKTLFDYLGIGFPPVKTSVGSANERKLAAEQYEAFQASLEEKRTLSRRDFFKQLRDRAVPRVSQPAKGASAKGEAQGSRRPTTAGTLRVQMFKKYGGGLTEAKMPVPCFFEMSAGEACTGCGACANLCPTGALATDDGLESLRLLWTPAHCSRCNLCFDVCSRKTLHRESYLNAGKIAGETTSVIKEFYRYVCPECGKSALSSGPATLCSDCTRTGNFMNAVSAMIYGEERGAAR